jgi:cellulose synthase operon protein YhjQ
MNRIVIVGLKGGVGAATVAGNLPHALHLLRKETITVDLAESNLLRLHFKMDIHNADGWSRCYINNECWTNAGYESSQRMRFIPFGTLEPSELERYHAKKEGWITKISGELSTVDMDSEHWQIIHLQNLEHNQRANKEILRSADIVIVVINPDPVNYYLIHSGSINLRGLNALVGDENKIKLLINNYQPESEVSQDFRLVLQKEFTNTLLPVSLHRDTTVIDSIANLTNVHTTSSHSQAAHDYQSLAFWCVTHLYSRSNDKRGECV